MLQDGELNLGAIPAYAARLARDGISGAFICGTTGEGASLTTDERRRVAAAWIAARPPALKLIVHVGHNANAESRVLAQHAQKIGADAVAAMAPGFFRPANVDDLVAWCAQVAAAAPRLPFYYYHIPLMVGAYFPMAEFLPRAVQKIPSFAGIKFTHENLMDYAQTLAVADGRYSVMAGRDEILLSYLALGAECAVGSTYNYAAPIYRRLIAAHGAGDFRSARKWQAIARAFIVVISRSGDMSANKAMMGLVTGLDCGPVRSPLQNLTAAQIRRLRADLEAAGLFTGLAESART